MAKSTYDIWSERIQDGKKELAEHAEQWRRLERLYSNTYDYASPFTEKPRVNYARNNLQRFASATRTPRKPYIFCTPTREHAGDGRLEELILNDWQKSSGFREQYRWMQFRLPIHGVAWWRTGYDFEMTPKSPETVEAEKLIAYSEAEEEYRKLMDEEVTPKAKKHERHPDHIMVHRQAIEQLMSVEDAIPREIEVRILEEHIDEHQKMHESKLVADYDDVLSYENAWAKCWDPKEVVKDPYASTIEDAAWIAFGSYPTIADLQADKTYKHTKDLYKAAVVGRVQPEEINEGAVVKGDATTVDEKDSLARVHRWEIFTKENGGEYIVLVDNYDKILRHDPNPYSFMGRFPARCCRLSVPVPDDHSDGKSFYPEPELATWEHLQKIIDYIAARTMDDVKKSKTIMGHNEAVSPQEAQSVASAKDLEIVPMQDVNAWREFALGNINPTLLTMLPIYGQMLSDMSGVGSASRGTMEPKSHVPASQVTQLLAQSAELFVDWAEEMKSTVEFVLKDVLAILKEFKDIPEQVFDPETKQWRQWDRSVISKDVAIDVELGTDVSKDKQERRETWATIAQILPQLYGMLMQAQIPPPLVGQILAGLLDSFNIRGVDKLVEAISGGAQPPMGMRQQTPQGPPPQGEVAEEMTPEMEQQMMAQGGMM